MYLASDGTCFLVIGLGTASLKSYLSKGFCSGMYVMKVTLLLGQRNSHHVAKGRYFVLSTHCMESIWAVVSDFVVQVGSTAFTCAIFWLYSIPILDLMSLGSGWSRSLEALGGVAREMLGL